MSEFQSVRICRVDLLGCGFERSGRVEEGHSGLRTPDPARATVLFGPVEPLSKEFGSIFSWVVGS